MDRHRKNTPCDGTSPRRITASVCAAVVVCAIGVTHFGRPASAQDATGVPTARLAYTRGVGADRCPDEAALRDSVAARMGRDPFVSQAAMTVSAVIERVGRRLRATIEARDAAGNVTGSRTLEGRGTDCAELASTVALAISIAVDPLGRGASVNGPTTGSNVAAHPDGGDAAGAADAAALDGASGEGGVGEAGGGLDAASANSDDAMIVPPAGDVDRGAMRDASAADGASAAQHSPVALEVVAGTHFAFGTTTATVSPGVTAGVGLRWRVVTVGLEARFDFGLPPPVARPFPGSTPIVARLFAGSLVPCVWATPGAAIALGGCGVLTVGALESSTSAGVGQDRGSAVYAAAGLRVAARFPARAMFGLRWHADLLGSFTPIDVRYTYSADLPPRTLWTTPIVTAATGLAFVGAFP